MKKRNIFILAAVLAITAITLHARAADKLKVGFVYLGPVGDLGWTFQHDVGRKKMMDALGDRVDTTYLENVPESADAERALEQLARSGHQLIFATSFGYMEQTLRVAEKYPKVHFEHATGYKRAANVSTYDARWYEGDYLQGVIAGKISKSGVLGWVVPFPIPLVISGINASILGAQTGNPNIKIKIIWVNTWFDPPKEADAAKALADQGADVLLTYTDSPAVMQIAEQRGIHAFGRSSDMINFGPHAQLTATVNNWGPYYIKRAEDELAGKWKSEATWSGLDSECDRHGALYQYAGRREEAGVGHRSSNQGRHLASVQVSARRSGRQDSRMQRRQPSRRRSNPKHELLRQRHRRQNCG